MKIKRKSKYLLVGGAIIGALAIIAGSTAAVTIHSNSKSLTTSPTKASSDNNNPNSTSSSRNDSGIGTTNSNSSGNNNGSNVNNASGTTSQNSGNSSNSKNANATNGESSKNGTSSISRNNTSNSGSTGTKTGNSGSQNSSNNDGSDTNGKSSNKGTNNGNQTSGSSSTQTNPKNTQPQHSPTSTNSNHNKTNSNGTTKGTSSTSSAKNSPNPDKGNSSIPTNKDNGTKSLGNDNSPAKSISGTNSNQTIENDSVTSLLNSLLSNIINVKSYYSSNDVPTVQNAFTDQTTLDKVILSSITNELENSKSKFLSINSNDSIKNIVDNIKITLPTTLSATDIELAQISYVTLSYANTLLENTSNTSNFIVEGFQSTVQTSDIQSINEQITQMIENNLDNIMHTIYYNDIIWQEPQFYGLPNNAVVLSGLSNITASEALNISSYKQKWINIFEDQIIGPNTKTFTFDGITFTKQEIAASLTINVNNWQFINAYGEIPNITLSYAQNNLTFSYLYANMGGYFKFNSINIFGFDGFSTWQNLVKQVDNNQQELNQSN